MPQNFTDFDRLAGLALKRVSGTLTPDEDAELSAFLRQPGFQEKFDDMVVRESVRQGLRHWEEAQAMQAVSQRKVEKALKYFSRSTRVRTLRTWGLVAATASALVIGTTIYLHKKTPVSAKQVAFAGPDLSPGGQKATLTLGSGRKIVLDSASTGRLAVVAGSVIEKPEAGLLQYSSQPNPAAVPAAADFNTLSTPMGGVYHLVLPDQSVVWLNSASSLHYPTYFDPRGPRVVQLSGEAFFQVSASAGRPFRVMVNGQMVQALGTQFDINGYADEPAVRTTLIQGRVKVSIKGDSVLLRPGEQAEGGLSGSLSVAKADTESIMAWKKGYFRFMGAPMSEVARQLSRWYNFKIVYKGDPGRTCAAEISRDRPAREVLEALKESGFDFSISGGEIDLKPTTQ